MSISVNDRVRLTARMQAAVGVTIENVYDVRCDTAPTGDEVDVMGDFATWLGTAYGEVAPNMTSALVAVELRGHNVTHNTPLPTVGWSFSTSPSSSADLYATGVAALVLLRTAANKVVGRKFIGGLTEAAIGNSLLVAGAVGNLVAYGLAIQAGPTMGVDNGTFEFGIYDKHGVYHAVTSLVVATVLAYQRRRKQGIGI